MERESIKFIHSALDDDGGGEIVLRGVVDPASLALLKVAEYQRERLPMSQIKSLEQAIRSGGVPDIDLGMRGGSYIERDGAVYLQNDVYIVDGLQRRTAALELLKKGILPRLGAVVNFNTTESWERNRFRVLNTSRVKLSSSVLLRNLMVENEGIELLYHLCLDSKFILHDKVSWQQRMLRTHFVTALQFVKASSRLHHRFGASTHANYYDLAGGFKRMTLRMGRNVVRENIKTYWEVVDECWGISKISFKDQACWLRDSFQTALAKMLASHTDFWDDTRLVVSKDLRRKLSLFPVTDPQVQALAGSGGSGREILYAMMVNHINSGKRTRRLTPFQIESVNSVEDSDEENEE